MDGEEAALEKHVRELRRRVIYSVSLLAVASGVAFYFSPRMLEFLQADLGVTLHALTAYEVLYTQLTLSIIAGITVSLPFIMYQLLKFAQPGLKRREYTAMRNFLPFSYLLFLAGGAFTYQFVVKNALEFFRSMTDASRVESVWGLQSTLGFAVKLSVVTGLLFQMPVVSAVLAHAGLVTSGQMRRYRVYVIVAVLVLSALATPPDIVTQLMVTAPVILLYEISILIVERIEG